MFCYFRSFLGTRLLGRFAAIFYLNCEHVLFVYILKQRRKKFRGFFKKPFFIFKTIDFFCGFEPFCFVHFYLFLSLIIFNTLHFSAMFVFVWFIPRRPKVTYLELFHQNLIIGKHIFTRPPFLFKILFYPDGPGE